MSTQRARHGWRALACLLALSFAAKSVRADAPPTTTTPVPAPVAETPPISGGTPTPDAAPPPDTAPRPAPAPAPEPAPAATDTPPPAAAQDEQIISDPELAASDAAAPSTAASTVVNNGDAQTRLVLHSRVAGDLRHEDPREEIWDSTTLATLDMSVRRSDRLRFALGVRSRFRFATLAHDVKDAHASHHELDLLPTAGYVDLKLAPGLHLQLGYQSVHLGRFDVFSATNVLAASDLRDGPATMPEGATELGQLAALVDYDVTSWLSVRAVYVPFFVGHVVAYTESDYAIFPASQGETEGALNAVAGGGSREQARFTKLVHDNLSRGDRQQLAAAGFAALAPEPTFTHPQGAVRVTAHGPSGELGFTLGSALEHLPSLEFRQSLVDDVAENSPSNQAYLAAGPAPIRIHHDRFLVAALDGATDVGPVTLGVEAALMKGRTLYAWRTRGFDQGLPEPAHADLAHLGVRAEFTASDEWLAAVETFTSYALAAPDDSACYKPQKLVDTPKYAFSPCRFAFMEAGRYLHGIAGLVSFSPAETGWHFEVGSAFVTGPSLVLTPRVAYSPWDELQLELGALFIQGKSPNATNAPQISVGAIYDHVDEVFLGVRYLP